LQTPNLEEVEAIGVGDGTIRKSVGQFLLALHTYYSSISTRLPEILDCSFQLGLRTLDFGKGEAVGGRGWYRSKERLVSFYSMSVHINFSSICTRFRDIAVFVLQHATFSLLHSYSG